MEYVSPKLLSSKYFVEKASEITDGKAMNFMPQPKEDTWQDMLNAYNPFKMAFGR